jgi:hypothetical protein
LADIQKGFYVEENSSVLMNCNMADIQKSFYVEENSSVLMNCNMAVKSFVCVRWVNCVRNIMCFPPNTINCRNVDEQLLFFIEKVKKNKEPTTNRFYDNYCISPNITPPFLKTYFQEKTIVFPVLFLASASHRI